MNPYSVIGIEPCGDYKLRVTFADGKINVVDYTTGITTPPASLTIK